MKTAMSKELPVRIGVFSTVDQARRAVNKLLAAGFGKENVTVICSDDTREQEFREFEHQDPAGTFAPAAAATGGALGVALGGLAGVALTLASGGMAVAIGGALTAWAGGVVGGLIGAMMTRGVEHELADYYDQAVTRGNILVAVDDNRPEDQRLLRTADAIFTSEGAEPVAIDES
jgi:hypothetical protein